MIRGCLQTTVQGLVNDSQELQRQHREKSEMVERLDGDMGALQLGQQSMQEQLNALQEQVRKQGAENLELKRTVSTVQSELDRSRKDFKQQLQKLKADFEAQLQAVQQKSDEDKVAVEGRLGKVETSTQTMQEEIEELKAKTATKAEKAELQELSREVMALKNDRSVPLTYLPRLEEIEKQLKELQRKEKELEQGCAATGENLLQNNFDLREEISAFRVELKDLREEISALRNGLDKTKQLSEDNEGKLMQMSKLCCSHCPCESCCPDSD